MTTISDTAQAPFWPGIVVQPGATLARLARTDRSGTIGLIAAVLYFLLADMHSRFAFLQEGLAIILAFVGVKMIIAEWYHIPTWLSLVVIAIVLTASVGFSMKVDRLQAEAALAEDAFAHHEAPPPPSER